MTNDHGALTHGAPGSRTVVVLNRKGFRALAKADDILLTSTAAARRVVLAACRLGMGNAPPGSPRVYQAFDVRAVPGHERMLKSIASSVAYEDDMRWLDYEGDRVEPRRFPPMAGLRRRGYAALRHVQKAHGLNDARMAQVLEQLRLATFR